MPVLGVLIGEGAASFVGPPAKYFGVAILAGAGVYSLLQSGQGGDKDRESSAYGMRLLVLAVALSLDNLTVGFGLGMLHVSLGISALVFGAISLLMTLCGLEIGRWLGRAVKFSAEMLTGIVLIATAGLMLL